MIEKASKLRSLCLVGLDIDDKQLTANSSSASSSAPTSQSRDPSKALIKTSTQSDIGYGEWRSRTLLAGFEAPLKTKLPYLTHLELRRIEVAPDILLSMLESYQTSLQELYLDHVYLKTEQTFIMNVAQQSASQLWVGLPNETPGPRDHWIAVRLRQMRLRLRVCRATNLGYDQYTWTIGTTHEASIATAGLGYDTEDPSGLGRSLEQRFVEVALGYQQPPAPDGSPVEYLPEDLALQPWALADRPPVPVAEAISQPTDSNSTKNSRDGAISSTSGKENRKGKGRVDETNEAVGRVSNSASTHAQASTAVTSPCQCQRHQWWSAEKHLEGSPHPRNPTSGWTRYGIDGRFANCNPFTLHELQHVADTALEGMSLVQMLDFDDHDLNQGQNQNQAGGSNNVQAGGANGNDGGDVAGEDEDESEDESEDGYDEDGLAGLRSVMFAAGVTDDGEDASGS